MALPTEAVEGYLCRHLPALGSITGVRKFDVGQSNPTYLLTTTSGRFVLRAKPNGALLKSAHAVEREFRVLEALHGSEVPVPRPVYLCTDRSVMGSEFYVMEYVHGQVHVDPTMPGVSPVARRAVYDAACRLLVTLNRIDPMAVGLSDYGRPGGHWRRQVNRWTEQYRAAETERRPAVDQLIQWLPDQVPADDDGVSLVHGDFRLDNLIVDDQGEIRAVIDWELSTLGSPFADLAHQCAQWRLPSGSLRGLAGVDRSALGIPTEREYVESYCQGRGLAGIPHWEFYLVASLFRLAAICQGVYRRGLEGNASSAEALGFGAKTEIIAQHAINIASGAAA